MFRERLVSGIVMLILVVIAIVSGGYLLFGTVLLISLLGLIEFYKIEKLEKTTLGVIGYLMCSLFYIQLLMEYNNSESLIILFLILLILVYVLSFPKYKSSNIMIAFFGLFYIPIMLSYIYRIRTLEDGIFLVGLIFISAWGCDTCAYCVGMLIGKHKLAPKLSPKKSIEGSVGGIVGAALIGALYGLFVGSRLDTDMNISLWFAVICGFGGVISQMGDLMASAIKRNYNIKDYGHLIPGHGGILDRFDSIIVTAPIIYYLYVFILERWG